MKKLYALLILDGFGIGKQEDNNAIYLAGTPNITRLMNQYPNTSLFSSGMAVGLPSGQMGNSEVGHLNIGAGRIVYQELTRITAEIQNGNFFTNPELLWAVNNASVQGKALHLMGLVSDGGVHSHTEHLYALLELAKRNNLTKVYVHCFLDGRDVPPTSGKECIETLQSKLSEIGVGQIATVMGRYYAMDRDNRWERVKIAYDAMVLGQGMQNSDPAKAVQDSYGEGINDEFVKPVIVTRDGKPAGLVEENDSIIFFNFRPDRAREITRTFIEKDFSAFERAKGYFPVSYVCLTQYDEKFTNMRVAFKPQLLNNTFGELLSKHGKTQLRIAETEKYAHVTFFFNGGVETPNEGEDRALIPSPKVATYDLKPEMSAYEVTEEAIKRIESGVYDVMVLNFANADMVGHTGIMKAAEKAVRTVDECVGRIVAAIQKNHGSVIITADHGNCDEMMDEHDEVITAHSCNPVPFILVDEDYKQAELRWGGKLCDIVPTMLDMMGIEKPDEMTGASLLDRK
ncbi:MAG: 2,3-bisphosphoglycerate-independent phosphoglycerate mutase [Christensenellales bacterium]